MKQELIKTFKKALKLKSTSDYTYKLQELKKGIITFKKIYK